LTGWHYEKRRLLRIGPVFGLSPEREREREKWASRMRESEIEDGRENADPHSRNARYSGGIARNCCTLSASFLDCSNTVILFPLPRPLGPTSRPTDRPTDRPVRVRVRACTRYISRAFREYGHAYILAYTFSFSAQPSSVATPRCPRSLVPHGLPSTFRGGKVGRSWLEIYQPSCMMSGACSGEKISQRKDESVTINLEKKLH